LVTATKEQKEEFLKNLKNYSFNELATSVPHG
jgi:hypothetical protein